MAYIPNFPAPERASGEYTGNPAIAALGGTHGYQPQGPNNPLGDVPGVPAMTLTGGLLSKLSGPQDG